MSTPKRYLVTSALPYANGLKHIGHLAGAYIPADIYVRYLRAQKRDVVFVCGSDEHGTAIPIQAKKEGSTPQAIIDKYHQALKEDFEALSVSLIFITVPVSRCITKLLQNFLRTYMKKGLFLPRKANNIMTKRRIRF